MLSNRLGTTGFKFTVGLLAFARSNTRTLLLTDSASSLALAITPLSSCVSPWRVFKLGLEERDGREQRKGGEEEIRKRGGEEEGVKIVSTGNVCSKMCTYSIC